MPSSLLTCCRCGGALQETVLVQGPPFSDNSEDSPGSLYIQDSFLFTLLSTIVKL